MISKTHKLTKNVDSQPQGALQKIVDNSDGRPIPDWTDILICGVESANGSKLQVFLAPMASYGYL